MIATCEHTVAVLELLRINQMVIALSNMYRPHDSFLHSLRKFPSPTAIPGGEPVAEGSWHYTIFICFVIKLLNVYSVSGLSTFDALSPWIFMGNHHSRNYYSHKRKKLRLGEKKTRPWPHKRGKAQSETPDPLAGAHFLTTVCHTSSSQLHTPMMTGTLVASKSVITMCRYCPQDWRHSPQPLQ